MLGDFPLVFCHNNVKELHVEALSCLVLATLSGDAGGGLDGEGEERRVGVAAAGHVGGRGGDGRQRRLGGQRHGQEVQVRRQRDGVLGGGAQALLGHEQRAGGRGLVGGQSGRQRTRLVEAARQDGVALGRGLDSTLGQAVQLIRPFTLIP